jgi:hypothetical protein
MVFQSYALYPHLTVYDNIAFGLRLQKLKKNEIDRRVQEVARILGVEQLLKRKPRALSGGQRQRVAMGRAHRRGLPGWRHESSACSLRFPFDTAKTAFERQEHLQIGHVLTPSIITSWVAPKQATHQPDLQGFQAL